MPREAIHCDGPYHVKVGWSPGTLQVGVETDEGRSLLWLLYGDRLAQIGEAVYDLAQTAGGHETREALGARVLNLLDVIETLDPESPVPAQEGDDPNTFGYRGVWTVNMTREESNRLIRLLRKGRDRAYGADA